jgi:hypothetical protein
MLPVAFVAKYGLGHGLWAASALLYVVALLAVVPALVLRLGLGSRISFWEWAGLTHAVAFAAYGLATRDSSLRFFTLIGLGSGGILTLSAFYFVWRARRK